MPNGPFTRKLANLSRVAARDINELQEALENTPTLAESGGAAIARVDPGVVGANDEVLAWRSGGPVWLRTQGVLNVENHGVRTTNTASQNAIALNGLFASIRSGAEPSRRVFFPSLYSVDTTILVNQSDLELFGVTRERSGLTSTTANIPVLRWNDEKNGERNIHVHDLWLGNSTNPTALTTQQYGIQFRATVDGTGGLIYGYHNCAFTDLWFSKQYIGIGEYSTGTGKVVIWATEFRRIVGQDIKYGLIRLVSSTSAGQPRLVISDIDVLNYGAVRNDPGGGYAIEVSAANGLSLRDVNIEKWKGTAIYIVGGAGGHLSNLRIEWQDHSLATDTVVTLVDGHFTVDNAVISFESIGGGGPQSIFYIVGANDSARISGVSVSTIDPTPTGTMELIRAPAGVKVELSGFSNQIPSVLSEYLPVGWGEPGSYARTSVNGSPPAIDVLPTASATYRGRMFRVEGGAGVADVTYICRKDAANAYGWVAI